MMPARHRSQARREIRGRLQGDVPQHVGGALDHAREFEIPLHVARRLGGDLRHETVLVRAREEVIFVGAEDDGRMLLLLDVQPVPFKLQIPDDFRMQQADRVGTGGVSESRVKLLRHGRAPDEVAALEHSDLQTLAGQVARTRQAVVPWPDDDNVQRCRSCHAETPLRARFRCVLLMLATSRGLVRQRARATPCVPSAPHPHGVDFICYPTDNQVKVHERALRIGERTADQWRKQLG